MGEYITTQGDTWDSIAFELYGNEKYMEQLIEANREYIDWLIFPAGIVLDVPDLEEEIDNELPYWRLEDGDGEEEDEEEDDEEEVDGEEGDDEE